jgi:GT2 family glycosyltransferase/peptidoglycan/xylan/chitin deacetylase (PgdA/CDA1 family)
VKVSVVIASHNRREALRRCIASLAEQEAPAGGFEVVVVLDGPTDGSRQMLEALPHRNLVLRILEQANQGQGAARNAGARAARGEILLLLDDDFTCSPGLLRAHAAAHSPHANAVVFGPIRPAAAPAAAGIGERLFAEDLERWCSYIGECEAPRLPQDAWAGPNCSMRLEVFLACGGYDTERFRWRHEDIELGWRLWKQGLGFRYAPRAVAWHHWSKDDAQVWRDAELDGASEVVLCRKHPEYRAYCGLAAMVAARPSKRAAAKAMACFPALAYRVLGAALAAARRMPWPPASLSIRLYRMRQNVARLAGARWEAGSWSALRAIFRPRLAVLLYHHVGTATPRTSQESLTVSPAQLERHVAWLRRRGYSAITPAMWIAWRVAGTPLPRKPVMITFDDGYADLVANAFPVLRRHGFGAAAFVITGKPGGLETWEGLPVMTGEQIRQCHAEGIEIGGHGRTHRELTAICDADVVDEVAGSHHDLAAMGLAPVSFAYPFGCHDERVRAAIAGRYQLAFTCDEGLNDLTTDPLLMRRTMVQPRDTLLDIELRAALGWSPFTSIRSALRVRSRARRVVRGLTQVLGLARQEA